MSQISDLERWKFLLENISSSDKTNILSTIEELDSLFKHLPPHVAPRIQRDYETYTLKTDEQLGALFDEIDLSNRQLLCAFLQLLISFGYFRLAQITYHVEEPRDELDYDPIYFPNLTKCKWYDMSPLLPKAGTLGWKGLMNSGLVKEEKEFLRTCIGLLSLKLQFCSVTLLSNQYKNFTDIIKRNGEKVAEKLFEIIKDVAYSDDCLIGLDSALFNLLLPFLSETQLTEVIDSTIQDIFKPFTLQRAVQDQEIAPLYELIKVHILNKAQLQDVMFNKLLEHLKTNIIRRKRRHSVEAATENGNITLESVIVDIYNGENFLDILSKADNIEVSDKSLQSSFISYWVSIIGRIIPQDVLSGSSSLKLLATCSIIIVTCSEIINEDLIRDISLLMAIVVENTSRYSNLFNSFDPITLIQFTKILSQKTQLLANYGSAIELFYKSYLNKYLRQSVMRYAKSEIDKFANFITFICDKNLDKTPSHLLQSICVHELATLVEILKNKKGNKVLDAFLDSARICSKRLYKFLLRNSPLKSDLSHDEEMDISYSEEPIDQGGAEIKKAVVLNALVSALKIAIIRQDRETLDLFSDLLLKIYGSITGRVKNLMLIAQNGQSASHSPIDSHLPVLLNLYIRHGILIKGYLNYDLLEEISSSLLSVEDSQENGCVESDSDRTGKKMVFNQIKSRLEVLNDRAQKSGEVYHMVINKYYSTAIDQTIGSLADLKKEKSCFHSYQHQMKTFSTVATIVLSNCSTKTYERILQYLVNQLKYCDPLDHPKVLYILLLLESSIPKCEHSVETGTKADLFKELLPVISCSLSRISKSVESGPSIHAFTRSGAHKSNKAIQCCTYASCIKIYTLIFQRYPPRMTGQFMTDAMQICVSSNLLQYSKHSAKLYKFFIQLASSIAGLLKSIGISRSNDDALKSSLPIFLSIFSNLIRCLILASDRQKLEVLPKLQSNGYSNVDEPIESAKSISVSKTFENQLELLAIDVARILADLSLLRVRLVDYAPHLISAYIKDVQRASCPDFVKLRLNEGIFRIFNLVDAHQQERQEEVIEAGVQRKTRAGRASGSLFDMIHARLDQASREIFHDMHDDYNRFHRYQGKI